MTACQNMMLLSIGVPLMPGGGSFCERAAFAVRSDVLGAVACPVSQHSTCLELLEVPHQAFLQREQFIGEPRVSLRPEASR